MQTHLFNGFLALKTIIIIPNQLFQNYILWQKLNEATAFKRKTEIGVGDEVTEPFSEAKAILKRLDSNQPKTIACIDTASFFRIKMEKGQIRQVARLLESKRKWWGPSIK